MGESRNRVYNRVLLRGKAVSAPVVDNVVEQNSFYRVLIEIQRKSGVADVLPVMMHERHLPNCNILGKTVEVVGEVHSFPVWSNGKEHNILRVIPEDFYVYSEEEALMGDLEPLNDVKVVGEVIDKPLFRYTSTGCTVCDVLIRIPGGIYKDCKIYSVFWHRNAYQAGKFAIGRCLEINGRIQTREYKKKTPTGEDVKRVAYELNVLTMTKL